jgi:hypothetical protein
MLIKIREHGFLLILTDEIVYPELLILVELSKGADFIT